MRNIKFRVWDKENKIMRYNAEQAYNGCYQMNDVQYFGQLINNDKYELMQYTGCKDKNGKEICEGDIVDIRYAKNYKHRYLGVIYDRGAFRINDKWSQHDLGLYITEKIEVVGNIYENPELLNTKGCDI